MSVVSFINKFILQTILLLRDCVLISERPGTVLPSNEESSTTTSICTLADVKHEDNEDDFCSNNDLNIKQELDSFDNKPVREQLQIPPCSMVETELIDDVKVFICIVAFI